jgi:hypothetical protein
MDSFPYPDCGRYDACYLRRDTGIRSQSYNLEAMQGIDHRLPVPVLLFEGSTVSNPCV